MSSLCVVFLCNKPYFDKFLKSCEQLITNGNYKRDICLVIGDDLLNDTCLNNDFIKENHIIVKHFPNILFNENFYRINQEIRCDGRNIHKNFQWHKLHLFNVFFKRWNYIFYLDCGIKIFSDIAPLIKEAKKNTLLAHSDSYPTYVRRLYDQFDQRHPLFLKLKQKFNLSIDYFQTTILLYDNSII